jgi:hypothetical protein
MWMRVALLYFEWLTPDLYHSRELLTRLLHHTPQYAVYGGMGHSACEDELRDVAQFIKTALA